MDEQDNQDDVVVLEIQSVVVLVVQIGAGKVVEKCAEMPNSGFLVWC